MSVDKLNGKTIVVKYGGNAMKSEQLKKAVVEDIALLHKEGVRIVLVHGGGPEIETMLKALSIESRFIDGLRYTDRRTMEIVQMVLCGKVNKDLTALAVQSGAAAIGLSGIDGGLLRAHKTDAGDFGFVGDIDTVNSGLLTALLDAGLLPVVSTVALNTEPDGPLSLNINADTAASRIASAMKAEKLVIMTDTAGILRQVSDPGTLIPRITTAEIPGLKESGVISGGMIPKVDGAAKALENGVADVHIIDGRTEHALRDALLSDTGTTITPVEL
jgi:acetylglutamate kinase